VGNGRALTGNGGVVHDNLAGITGLLVLARSKRLGGRLTRRRTVVVPGKGPGCKAEREQRCKQQRGKDWSLGVHEISFVCGWWPLQCPTARPHCNHRVCS